MLLLNTRSAFIFFFLRDDIGRTNRSDTPPCLDKRRVGASAKRGEGLGSVEVAESRTCCLVCSSAMAFGDVAVG